MENRNILDAPLDTPAKPRPKRGLGLLLGCSAGSVGYFLTYFLLDLISMTLTISGPIFASLAFLGMNLAHYWFIIASLYRFSTARRLLLTGILTQTITLIIFMKIMEGEAWHQIFYKPHLFSYPALSLLILQTLLLWAWIMLLKKKKFKGAILLLLCTLLIGLANA